MAVPPSTPGYHASRTAAACWLAQLRATALPLCSTTISGLPVAATASSSFCCGAGRSRLVRSPPPKPGILMGISSPSSCGDSPTKATTTSASFARATASSNCACAGACHLSVRPPPARSPECEYSTGWHVPSCRLKSTGISGALGKFIDGRRGGRCTGGRFEVAHRRHVRARAQAAFAKHFAVEQEAIGFARANMGSCRRTSSENT